MQSNYIPNIDLADIINKDLDSDAAIQVSNNIKKATQKILDDLIQMAQENIIKMQSSSSIQIKNNDSTDLFYTINLFYKKLGIK